MAPRFFRGWFARVAAVLVLANSMSATVEASQQANLSLYCFSVRLGSATVQPAVGFVYRFDASVFDDGTVNGELWPTTGETDPTSHATVMQLTVPGVSDPLKTILYLDVPLLNDANLNDLYDFFEVTRAVSGAKSTGSFTFDDGMDVYLGVADAVWTRSIGAAQGTCKLHLKSADLALDVTFNVPFEIFKYNGTLTYTPEPLSIPTLVDLVREGTLEGAGNRITGAFDLVRTNINELGYLAGHWTNSAGLDLSFISSQDNGGYLLRGPLRTNYFSSMYFDDGLPETPATGEYQTWFMDVYDPNDVDHNHVPDLSDEPPVASPPVLVGLVNTAATLKLKFNASAGQNVVVEATDGLIPAAWATVRQIAATGGTDEVDLGPPGDGARFFRLRGP